MSPVLRSVSAAQCRWRPSRRRHWSATAPGGVGEDEPQPGDVGRRRRRPGGSASDRPGPVRRCSRRCAQPDRFSVQASTVTRSAPGREVTGPMPVTVNRSKVSALASSTTVSRPGRWRRMPLRTPRVIVLCSAVPATALPSVQAFVATGRTTRGTTTSTSARSLDRRGVVGGQRGGVGDGRAVGDRGVGRQPDADLDVVGRTGRQPDGARRTGRRQRDPVDDPGAGGCRGRR